MSIQNQILLVDDNQYLRNAVTSYLQDKGFQVTSVSSVAEAIQHLTKQIPNLIISDIVMPQMNGYDLIKYIQANKWLTDVPIILLTAKGMTQDRIKGYNLGCSSYLPKPFDPSELVSIINNLILNTKNNSESIYNTLSVNNASIKFSLLDIKLTPRELSILQLVIRGLPNKEIAKSLYTSKRNVEKYVSRLLLKTKTRNRTELAQYILLNNYLYAIKVNISNKANDGTRTRE